MALRTSISLLKLVLGLEGSGQGREPTKVGQGQPASLGLSVKAGLDSVPEATCTRTAHPLLPSHSCGHAGPVELWQPGITIPIMLSSMAGRSRIGETQVLKYQPVQPDGGALQLQCQSGILQGGCRPGWGVSWPPTPMGHMGHLPA